MTVPKWKQERPRCATYRRGAEHDRHPAGGEVAAQRGELVLLRSVDPAQRIVQQKDPGAVDQGAGQGEPA